MKNRFEILLSLIVINGIIGTLLLMNIFYADVEYSNSLKYDKDLLLKQEFLEHKFDYWHGIWLMPIGLMFVFILVLFRTEIIK